MLRWLDCCSSDELFERVPLRALGTALVTTMIALTVLIWPSVASAQFDFTLTTRGPQSVTQGSPLYLTLTAKLVSGTSPTLLPITVTGLPAGSSVSFPDIAQQCCGTNQIYSLPANTTVQINTSATTPSGPTTLTITVTGGTVSRSVNYPITVTAVPRALSRQPYAADSSVPQLAQWQSNMTTYGQTFCGQLANTSLTNDQRLGMTFYDSQRVFYNIRDYTGATSWDTCALRAQAAYRDAYVVPNNGGVPGYWNFPHGINQSFHRTGDTVSKNAVIALSQKASYGTKSIAAISTMVGADRSREISFHLMGYQLGRAAGEPQSVVGDAYLDLVLGYIDQWFVSKNFRTEGTATDVPAGAVGQYYIQPFMVGLAAEAMIQYYETQAQDVRLPTAVKLSMDWLWANAWNGSAFWYDMWGPATGPYQHGGSAPDLNLLLAPAFAWLYKQTGDTTYRDRADAIFAAGVTGACVSCDSKHFNQQYRWSFDYLKWRSPSSGSSSSVPAAPSGLSVR